MIPYRDGWQLRLVYFVLGGMILLTIWIGNYESFGQGDWAVSVNTEKDALKIAQQYIVDLKSPHELVIQEEKTIQRSFGWIFFPTTKKYLETGNPAFLVPGVGPLVVERDGGRVIFLTTSVSPDKAIDEYERRWQETKKSE
jgi:hypothetical protein